MNKQYTAIVTALLLAGAPDLAHADFPPGNLCTMPGQPCMNGCPSPITCNLDAGPVPGICTTRTCRRYGPIDAGPDGDGGVVIGWMDYPCNLCIPTPGGAPEGGDADAPDAAVDGDPRDDADDGNDADDRDAEAGASDGTAGTGGSGDADAGGGGAAGTGGIGGTGGNAGDGGSGGAGAGAGGSSGTTGGSGAAGGAGSDSDSSDSGCSCIIDGDPSRTSRLVSAALGLAIVLGYSGIRRRARRSAKKDGTSR